MVGGDTFPANSYSFMYHQSHIIRLIKHQAEEEEMSAQ